MEKGKGLSASICDIFISFLLQSIHIFNVEIHICTIIGFTSFIIHQLLMG